MNESFDVTICPKNNRNEKLDEEINFNKIMIIDGTKVSYNNLEKAFKIMNKEIHDISHFLKLNMLNQQKVLSNYLKFYVSLDYDELEKIIFNIKKNQDFLQKLVTQNRIDILAKIKSLENEIEELNSKLIKIDNHILEHKNRLLILTYGITNESLEFLYQELSTNCREIDAEIIRLFICILFNQIDLNSDIIEVYLRNHGNLIVILKKFPQFDLKKEIIDYVSQKVESLEHSFSSMNNTDSEQSNKNIFPFFEWIKGALNLEKEIYKIKKETLNQENICNEIEMKQHLINYLTEYKKSQSNLIQIKISRDFIDKKNLTYHYFEETNYEFSNTYFNSIDTIISDLNQDIKSLYQSWGKNAIKPITNSKEISMETINRIRGAYCTLFNCFSK